MTRPATIAVVLVVAALTAVSLVPRPEVERFNTPACQASSLREARAPIGEMPDWSPPESTIQRLWQVDGTVRGPAPTSLTPIFSQSREELADWHKFVFSGGEVGWMSPVVQANLEGADTLRLTLVPGNARKVELTTAFAREIDRRQRGLRTMSFALDGEDPEGTVVLDGPLSEVLGGNWDDERFPDRSLRRLEMRVDSEAEAEGLQLVRLDILGREAAFVGRAAGREVLEVDGALRPGWFVRGGATVELDAEAVAGHFRASIAAIGDTVLTVHIGDQAHRLEPGETWAALDAIPTAGGKVRLTAEGDGIALLGSPRIEPSAPSDAPNVIVLLVDTLRADHLGAWGSRLGVSANLDALADQGASFGLAQSTASWTKPAIPTLMTGIWATTHQVGARSYTDLLPPTVPTLQGQLGAAGWRTGSFAASPLGSTLTGLERDFDLALPPRHWRGKTGLLGHPSLTLLSDALFAWWDEGDGPVFAYLHAMEVHAWRRALYQPHDGRKSYELALEDLDAKVGELRKRLEERGELDNTLIVITADHGESFGDHGVKDHGTSLFQSQVHVPLIFWAADIPASWSSDPVGLADVAPTILDLVGVPPLDEADGASLVPAIARGERVHDWVPTARERFVWRYLDPPIYAITTASHTKLIDDGGERRFFDLGADLCEAETSAWPRWGVDGILDTWLTEQRAARESFAERHPDAMHAVRADDVRMLEEMGYLE
ncbi:MAG: hypothetical protein EP330_30865 [Deltaproteobacteria bacterium]|nr:MAG: hypothetical protein EP330_30865 [Deltaproteobacteria bacterium]